MIIENIFNSLFKSQTYFNKVYPYLKNYYFDEKTPDNVISERLLFNKIVEFSSKYNKKPYVDDVKVLIEADMTITKEEMNDLNLYLDNIKKLNNDADEELLIDQTESWIKDKEVEGALYKTLELHEQIKKKNTQRCSYNVLRELWTNAISVGFQGNLGHDYFENYTDRFAYYNSPDEVLKVNINEINIMIGGGFRRKALYLFSGATNVGKSLIMCHLASDFLQNGLNVLYISGEMSENVVGHRIDANLLNETMEDLPKLKQSDYFNKIKNLKTKTNGILKIKEYATGTTSTITVLAYLKELELKQKFKPDVLIIDYLNLFASSQLSKAKSNSYDYVKSLTEEFRALSINENMVVITPIQYNREGMKSNLDNLDVTVTADSIGTAFTADFQAMIFQNDELRENEKYIFKVGKTRFASNNGQNYTIGVDRMKMRLYDVSEKEKEIPIHVKDKLENNMKNKLKGNNEIKSENGGFEWNF